ncbi:hypothetical protein F9L03_26380, partial [Brucella lupini]
MAGRRGRKFWENDRRKSLSQFGSETMACRKVTGISSDTPKTALLNLVFLVVTAIDQNLLPVRLVDD